MNAFVEIIWHHPLMELIGWTLVHSIWQGALIGVALLISLRFLPIKMATHRYNLACGSLFALVFCTMGTLAWLVAGSDAERWQLAAALTGDQVETRFGESTNETVEAIHQSPALASAVPWNQETRSIPTNELLSAKTIDTPERDVSANSFAGWMPWLSTVWLTGIALLSLRMAGGLWTIQRWRRRGRELTDQRIHNLVCQLLRKMNFNWTICCLESLDVSVPTVIGFCRPVLLVPVGIISGLTITELESILAHELAHIRRRDWLVNLFQTAAETMLFYHPAVWWMSKVIRSERENCCDDVAIAVCGDRLSLAKGLATLEESREGLLNLGLSATGGSLASRIRRILLQQDTNPSAKWSALLMGLATIVLFFGALWTSSIAATRSESSLQDSAQSVDLPHIDDKSPTTTMNDWPWQQREEQRVDPVTGVSHRVLASIRLAGPAGQQATVPMKYSNLFNYTFIPAKIAKELGAVELGEIDFGDSPPQLDTMGQTALDIKIDQLTGELQIPKQEAAVPSQNIVTVNELGEPAGNRTIVPYAEDAVWIPGHLAFYGVNPTEQKKFRVVRIEKVDLSLGPEFGPVNALVLDDANSGFGVLGNNWARIPRGPQGEGFVAAATGEFHFMKIDTSSGDTSTDLVPRHNQEGAMVVQESGHAATPPLPSSDVGRTLATHTYNFARQESSIWVEVNGVGIPVDEGVEHDGVKVYVTLMFDVVAVDKATNSVLWHRPWGKSMPIWETVSILELERSIGKILVVELSRNSENNEVDPLYLDLRTGDEVEGQIRQADGTDINTPTSDNNSLSQIARRHRDDGMVTEQIFVPGNVNQDEPAWGPLAENSGRQTRLLCMTPEPTAGKPLLFTLELRNAGEKPLEYDPQEYEPFRVLRAENTNGKAVHFIGMTPQTSSSPVTLQPGESTVLWKDVDAAQMFLLTEGEYKFYQEGAEWALSTIRRNSNSAILKVGPGQLPPQQSLLLGLMELESRPEDWQVSAGFGAIYISHSPTNLKQDVTTIQLWFTEEPLPDDYRLGEGPNRQEITTVGRCELGFLHIGATVRAKELWPEHLRDIRSAVTRALSFEPRPSENENNAATETNVTQPKEQIMRQQQLVTDDASHDEPAWGQVAENSGRQTRLLCQTPVPAVGEPLLFSLEIRNASEEPLKYDPQEYEPFRVLRAENTNDKAVHFIGTTPQTLASPVTLGPGESTVLWKDVDAAELFLLTEGEYKFYAEGGEWAVSTIRRDSNSLTVKLEPGRLPPRQSLMRGLLELESRPEEWQVSAGFGAIYLTHSPTNLKRDVTTIQLWFTDEPLPDDYRLGEGAEQQEVTTVGRCDLGYLHVGAPAKAKNLWPEHVRDIRNAATRALEFKEKPNTPDDETR